MYFPRFTFSTRAVRGSALLVVMILAHALAPALARADSAGNMPLDPARSQVVSADEQVAPHGTPATFTAGHADIGPVIMNGHVELMLRDDSSTPPTWRYLDDVTIRLTDAAKQQVTSGYDFTGAHPGDTVWAVPQTEVADVAWLGWNTQHPSIAGQDATLHIGPHEGEGTFSLFLQNGGFSAPQVIGEDMYIAPGTHAHANWVFTAPGRHVVPMSVTVAGEETAPVPLTFDIDGTAPATAGRATAWWVLGIGVVALMCGALVFLRGRK